MGNGAVPSHSGVEKGLDYRNRAEQTIFPRKEVCVGVVAESPCGVGGTLQAGLAPAPCQNQTVQRQGTEKREMTNKHQSTEQLLRAMKRDGLDPPDVQWDGCFHDLSGPDKPGDAYYIACPNGETAEFGHRSAGLERAHWAREPRYWGGYAARDREPTQHEPAAIELAETIWKRGIRTTISHHYLADRGITEGTEGLKLSKETRTTDQLVVLAGELLIPLRYQGENLVNLQLIRPDGRKRFLPDAPVYDCWVMIGRDCLKDGNRTLYVCVGWEVAWTIHQATGCAVAAVLVAGALASAAAFLKERYKCRVIVAAENDRWNEFYQGGSKAPVRNPGVRFVRPDAEFIGVDLAIPDFKSLSGCPSSFDDLRQREGMDPVRRWLDPERCDEATMSPHRTQEQFDDDWHPPKPQPESWVADAPFRCLGHLPGLDGILRDPVHFFFRDRFGRVVQIRSDQFDRGFPFSFMARSEWWQRKFPRRKGQRHAFDREGAVSALIDECFRVGFFDPRRIRKTGVWRDTEGNVVANLADQLLAPGATRIVRCWEYDGGTFVYDQGHLPKLPLWREPLSLAEAQCLLRAFDSLPWDDPAAGALLAGFLALGPNCGALERRPHLWVTGEEYVRSTFMVDVVHRLLSGMCDRIRDPRAIRNESVCDALVLTYECDTDPSDEELKEIRSMLDMARRAVTNIPVTRGTPQGIPRDIQHPSMVLLSTPAVPGPLAGEVGKYIHHLHLRNLKLLGDDRARQRARSADDQLYRDYTRKRGLLTGRRLWARTLHWFRSGRFDRLLDITTAVADELLASDSNRSGYAVLTAGTWMLLTDAIPTEDEVREWFLDKGLSARSRHVVKEGHKVLAKLIEGEVELGRGRHKGPVAVSAVLESVTAGKPAVDSGTQAAIKRLDRWEQARLVLTPAGIKVEDHALIVANQSAWIAARLAGTPHSDRWSGALRTIPGARPGPVMAFKPEKKSRTTVIPLRALKVAKKLIRSGTGCSSSEWETNPLGSSRGARLKRVGQALRALLRSSQNLTTPKDPRPPAARRPVE